MEQFKTLYRYELKKITGKKLFKITLALFLLLAAVLVVIQLTGKSYVDGVVVDTHYHMFLVDREYERALSGRAIDQSLLHETIAAYRTIPDPEDRYTLTEEYQTNARPYSAIYQLISRWTDTPLLEDVLHLDISESSFYEARSALLEKEWQKYFLTETEQNFWLKKETEISTPYTYYYHEGYTILYKTFNAFAILIPLFIAICLSGVFAEEHARRTDQLSLSALMSVFVMFLSEVLHNSTAALSVCTGFIILASMVSIPPGYRVLSQIWDWLPFSFLERTHVFDMRTLPLFGHCFISWQIVPVLYLLLSTGIASLGWRVYRRYQVSGR